MRMKEPQKEKSAAFGQILGKELVMSAQGDTSDLQALQNIAVFSLPGFKLHSGDT